MEYEPTYILFTILVGVLSNFFFKFIEDAIKIKKMVNFA